MLPHKHGNILANFDRQQIPADFILALQLKKIPDKHLASWQTSDCAVGCDSLFSVSLFGALSMCFGQNVFCFKSRQNVQLVIFNSARHRITGLTFSWLKSLTLIAGGECTCGSNTSPFNAALAQLRSTFEYFHNCDTSMLSAPL